MARAGASIDLPETRVADAEALWYDLTRWPSFIEGFKHVVSAEGDWPERGARVVWESVPDGRGRVLEHVLGHTQREGQEVAVEDPRITGTQRVRFAPGGEDGVRMTLELEYTLSGGGPLRAVTDLLFIRRAQSDALRRTLYRFARELEAERSL
jgi:uncharacterized membrane protein